MVKKTELIRIDLSQFKFRIRITSGSELTLHFDSPSRKFYLAVIALVVFEMKKKGKITSIPLVDHLNTLILLNNTVGGSAGSTKNLIPRIYRKWKDVLCDLEHGRLFKVIGRTKCYEDGAGKVYPFRDVEKDAWANLFEYKGSEQQVRLRFSIDHLSAGLDDVIIFFNEKTDTFAWETFIRDLEAQVKVDGIKPESDNGTNTLQKATGVNGSEYGLVDRPALYVSAKPSIAVLPFVNISNDPDQEYFCDGMSDELICALTKLDGLKVISRTSAFYFKGKDVSLSTIGDKLKVDHVLEGSVRKAIDRVRISAQLIRVADDNHLWAETYDRELEDIFTIQDDISQAVVENLKVKLLAPKPKNLIKDYTRNTEAYELFLKAKYCEKNAEYTKAVNYLKKSVQLDPLFVPAYATMGGMNIMLTSFQNYTFQKAKSNIGNCFQKAIAIDENYGELYISQGFIRMIEYDWSGAEQSYLRALELNPGLNLSHTGYSLYLAAVGRISDAITAAEHAVDIDPLSTFARAHLIWWLTWGGQLDRAEKMARDILELDPNDFYGFVSQAWIYLYKQQFEEALSIFQSYAKMPVWVALLGYSYGKTGYKGAAQKILNDFMDQRKKAYFSPFLIAIVHAGLCNDDLVFEWLDHAYEVKDPHQFWIRFFFSEFHSDSRWQQVLAKRGLAT